MTMYYQVFVSAENQTQANDIVEVIVGKKLASGGMITHGPSRFWWKGKIASVDYYNISLFTIEKKYRDLENEVRRISPEEVSMIWRIPLDANPEFFKWIDQSLA